ncbi:MAG: FAD-binding oxidoreductase [Acidimicrobiales bacterium]
MTESGGPTLPTPPIEWGCDPRELTEVFSLSRAELPRGFVDELRATGALVAESDEALAEASRDWWPIAQRWAVAGRTPSRPQVVVRPVDVSQVSSVLRLANRAGVPVTASGGRSGVCGSSVPLFGGISLDCCGLSGIASVDRDSLLVTVGAGTFGSDLEHELREHHGLTIGHWPQSMNLATVGGWIACRSAGQYSTRYGKIEDIVAGLEVVLADGRLVHTGALAGAGPRSAMGPDLTQLFVGSEGTLGIVTSAILRAHPMADHEARGAWSFASFEDGLEALRRTLRLGATPAVLRLYDSTEASRTFGIEAKSVLIALDEGHAPIIEAAMQVLAKTSRETGGSPLPEALVETWLEHRNDVSGLSSVTRAGIVVDTIEVAARWSELATLYHEAVSALRHVGGCLSASAHESHAYLDGACLYFTFAGRGADPADDSWAEEYYEQSWEAVMTAARRHLGSISHHHGIGIVRGPYIAEALGAGFGVLESIKSTLDPAGILNPGKLGLSAPSGETAGWPRTPGPVTA